jgi:KDO2-lipid IV(A) lauroyltransferase
MYIISDGIYGILFYVTKYRKAVVMNNLAIAFPEKSEAERIQIAKQFYRNFTDTFIETIKLISISKKEFNKRVIINADVVNNLYATGKNVQIHTGHFFNWEVGNLAMSANMLNYVFLGVYAPPKGEAMHRIIKKLRSKFGTVLIPSTTFKNTFHNYTKQPYVVGLVADQNPGDPNFAAWLPFFGKMTPSVTGPEKGAKRMDTAVVMMDFYKVKRGYYNIEYTLLTTEPKSMPDGKLTKTLIAFIENAIRQRPANYLWSHRRWKWEFDPEKHGHLVLKDV